MECDICKKQVTSSNYNGIVLKDGSIVHVCGKHYAQYRKFGKFLDSSQKTCHDTNEFKVVGDVATIYTKRNNGDISGFFIIDKSDLDSVITRKWRLWHGRFYTGVQKPMPITDFLFPEKESCLVIDHINHDPSDNRRSNLRIVTQQQNICNKSIVGTNSSGVSGVWFDKARDKWSCEIKFNYKKIHLGRYNAFEDACFARYVAENLLFGEYRNVSNDSKLMPIIEKCSCKDKIDKYVRERISKNNL